MDVYLAVMECKIKITELVMPTEIGGPHKIFNFYEFRSIAEFKKYLLNRYSVAKSLGYIFAPPVPEKYNELIYGRLGLDYKDNLTTTKLEFSSITDFVKFLDTNTAIANFVGYTQKR